MYILYDFKGVLIHIMKQLLLIREYTLAIFIVINKCLPSLIFLFVCLEGSLKHRFPFIWQCGVFCFPCSLFDVPFKISSHRVKIIFSRSQTNYILCFTLELKDMWGWWYSVKGDEWGNITFSMFIHVPIHNPLFHFRCHLGSMSRWHDVLLLRSVLFTLVFELCSNVRIIFSTSEVYFFNKKAYHLRTAFWF